MPNNKKRKLSPTEKEQRKIKTHTIHTAKIVCPHETWNRGAQYIKSAGKGRGRGSKVTKMPRSGEAIYCPNGERVA